MKKQLLKLIKGLNRFKADDLCQMAELEEDELLPYLDEFLSEGMIAKIGTDTYTILDKIPERQSKRKKNVTAEKIEKTKKLLQFSEEEIQKFKKVPENLRKPAEKYLKVLYATQDMTSKKVEIFLDNWNKLYPDKKMGFSSYSRAKQKLREEGLMGLIPKYNVYNKGQSIVKNKIYEKFKLLYLSPDAPELSKCYRQVKDEFAHLYEDWNFPSYQAFRRKLMKEHTEEEILIFRTGLKEISVDNILSSI